MDTKPELDVERVLALCKHRWETAGLAPADVTDMLDELRSHLAEAAAHGRTPAQVLGPDLEKLAQDWARARAPRWHRWLRLTLYVFVSVVVLFLLAHLHRRTTLLAVTPGFLFYVAGLSAVQLWWRPRGRPLTFPRFFLASVILLLPAAAAELWLLRDAVLFRVPLWITGSATLALGVAAWATSRLGPRGMSRSVRLGDAAGGDPG